LKSEPISFILLSVQKFPYQISHLVLSYGSVIFLKIRMFLFISNTLCLILFDIIHYYMVILTLITLPGTLNQSLAVIILFIIISVFSQFYTSDSQTLLHKANSAPIMSTPFNINKIDWTCFTLLIHNYIFSLPNNYSSINFCTTFTNIIDNAAKSSILAKYTKYNK